MREAGIMGIALALLSFFVSPAAAEEIRLIGGTSAISTVFSPIKESYEKATGDRLTIRLSEPTQSLIALEKGEVDFASINSLSVDIAIEKAKLKGVVIDPKSLHRSQIAQSRLVVFLDKSNPLTRLSKEQLKGIFTGKITNWREVGGDDHEIIVLWGKDTPYLNILFSKEILDGEPVTPKARQAGDHFELRKLVVATRGAIALNSSGLIMPKLKVPEIPNLPLPILIITKGKPSAKVEKVLAFYREEFGFMDE
jgi:phosphate transport system substrate-binding protein